MGIYTVCWRHAELYRGWVLCVRQDRQGFQSVADYPDGLGQSVPGHYSTLEDAIAAGRAEIDRDIAEHLHAALNDADLTDEDRAGWLEEMVATGQVALEQIPPLPDGRNWQTFEPTERAKASKGHMVYLMPCAV